MLKDMAENELIYGLLGQRYHKGPAAARICG
jgi:hypothetical protein